ncbi:hypothetical protein H8E07_12975 [bacterium]|nr:hypothetical protein [bacterium]
MSNERTDPTAGRTPQATDDVISLAFVLNILWRRRLIIVLLTLAGLLAGIAYVVVTKPLYRATATVRPGITNITEGGAPQRSWQLKDIVRWYRTGMYGRGVKEGLSLPDNAYRPDIMAEFIARGVGIQGGDVVTLNTLSPDQDTARRILEISIATFNEYAEINSVGNSLSLARAHLRNDIERRRHDRDDVAIKKDLLDLKIGRKREELAGIAIEQRRLELAVKEHLARQSLRAEQADILETGIDSTLTGLREMAHYLERMRIKEERQGDIDSTLSRLPETDQLPFLWWEMAQDKTAMAGRMVMNGLEIQTGMWEDRLAASDLRHSREVQEYQHESDLLLRNYELAYDKALLESEIREIEINRDRSLEQELIDIDDTINLLQSRVEVLTPLENIGVIIVSEGPVRPRKQRAVGLLTLMGFLGSLGLALVWEYLSLNRNEIFARER